MRLDGAAGEHELVLELRQGAGGDERLDGGVGQAGPRVRRADDEKAAHERRVPQREAVGDGAAPVVAEGQDARDVEVGGEGGEVVGGAAHGVEGEGERRGGAAVAEHVGGDDAEVEGEEVGDLGAEAEGEVGPAVDQEDGCDGGGGGGEEVVVELAVEEGAVVGDAGVVGGEFVHGGGHGCGWFGGLDVVVVGGGWMGIFMYIAGGDEQACQMP